MSSKLQAKSQRSGSTAHGGYTLVQHTLMVMRASAALCDVVGESALLAFGKPVGRLPELKRLVVAAAWAHDLGKCSSHFQEMLRGSRNPQARRHELLSSIILNMNGPLKTWFAEVFPDVKERACVLSAAASHHRKLPRPAGKQLGLRLCMGPMQDFLNVIKLAWSRFGFTSVALNDQRLHDVVMKDADLDYEEKNLVCVLRNDGEHDLHPLVRTLTICADVIGSVQVDDIVHKSRDAVLWLRETMDHRAWASGVDQMVMRRGLTLRPFQEAVGASDAPVTLVRAGCGSGKTLAALLWARQHAKDGRQLWFTYPTTGTASEGFAGYGIGEDLEVKATLEHSRRDTDLDHYVQQFGEAAVLGTLEDKDAEVEALDRAESLRLLGAPIIFSTADVPLGWLVLNRKGTYAAPAIVNSAIVFDEVHSYDDKMFGVLLRWLSMLPGIPALIMTASLSQYRLKLLQEVVLKTHGRDLPIIDGPEELEVAPRYELVQWNAASLVEEAVGRGERVLWVSNTVDRCVDNAREMRSILKGAAPVHVYHSRFKYRDRLWRHERVVRSFDPGTGPCVAFTTQVAEMSLDLDADLVVTDLAPVPALIQRLGRLNRRGVSTSTRPFVVIDGGEHLPYTEEEMAQARLWLRELGVGRPVSRRDLVSAWEGVQGPERIIPTDVPVMLENPDRAEPDSLREEGRTIQVVLEQDVGEPDLVEVLIPMNMNKRAEVILDGARRHRHVPVVTDADLDYNAEEGARWRP